MEEAGDPWGEERLQERKPAGMSPGAFLVVILVISMLLAVNLYALLALVSLEDEGNGKPPKDPPEHPWNVTVEARVIEGEEVWDDLSGRLEAPVLVPSGAKLTLRRCDLALHTLDLLWNRVPYILVEEGGKLDIEESTIRVVHDSVLDESTLGPTYNDRSLPCMSRVVNLEGTRDPMVEFDLKWRWEGTEVAVGVQLTPTSDSIRQLETITPDQAHSSEWTHFQVPLYDYVGLTPRVVLYFPTPPQDVVLVSRLRVTDGGEDLHRDLPYTGVHWRDGWDGISFVSFDNAFKWYGHNSTLIDLRGKARIMDSVLSVSWDLARRGDADYIKQELGHHPYFKNTYAAYRDWYVWVSGGELWMEGTAMDNVPLVASGSRVELADCEFFLGSDMVTLFNTSGNITSTEFQGSPRGPIAWLSEEARPVWAVSVENSTDEGPVTIRDCRFEDVPMGVDTGSARVEMEGNRFTNVSRLAVWSHRTEGIGRDDVMASNAFEGCEGLLYLRTESTAVSYKEEPVEAYWRTALAFDTEGMQIHSRDVNPNLYNLYYIRGGRMTVLRPEEMVYGNGTERRLANVTLRVNVMVKQNQTYHEGVAKFVVEPGVETLEVDLATLVIQDETHWWEDISVTISMVRFQPVPQEGEGTFNFSILLRVRDLYADNVTLDLVLDGLLERRYNMTEIAMAFIDDTHALFDRFVQLEPGAHEVNVVLSGNVLIDAMNLSKDVREIVNLSLQVMRATAVTPPSQVGAFIEGGGDYLLLDANASITVEGLEVAGDLERMGLGIHVIGDVGSSLVLVDPVGLELGNLYISYDGPVDLAVHGGELDDLWFEMEEYQWYLLEFGEPVPEGNIDIEGLTCDVLYMTGLARQVSLKDTTVREYLGVFEYLDSSFEMAECTVLDGGGYIYGSQDTVRVSNCTFRSTQPSTMSIFPITSELDVADCLFDGVNLRIQVEAVDEWTLGVRDCEFTGDGGILSVLWRHADAQDFPNTGFPVPGGAIEGNSFEGAGTGLVLHHALFGDLLGDNELAEGARAFAWYMPDVMTRQEGSIAQEEGYTIFVAEEGLVRTFPFGDEEHDSSLDDQMFIDVTDDLSKAIHPDHLDVVIMAVKGRYSVTGFGAVDPREDQVELTYPLWPLTDVLLREILEADWPWPLKPLGR